MADSARTAGEVAEAVGRGLEAGDVEQVMAELAHDVVMYGTVGGIYEERVLHGRDEVTAYFVEYGESWESLETKIDAIHASGEVAVLFHREIAHSSHTSVPIETETATLLRIRDGTVVELRGYMDRALAFAAFEDAANA